MIRLRVFALLALLAVAGPVLLDGCANKSVTSGGSTTAVPKPRMEERIVAAPVQEMAPPPEAAPVPLRSTEMAARNATGELNIPFRTSCSTSINTSCATMRSRRSKITPNG